MAKPFENLRGSYLLPDIERSRYREPQWPWPPWLVASWEARREFVDALYKEAELLLGGPAKSQPDTGIDWYADAVLRHLPHAGNSPVLRSYDPASGWQVLDRYTLDQQAGALAAVLAAAGAKPGGLIALVLPSGAPLLVGLLATLRLGCCAIPVLPLGSTYVRAILAACKAMCVVTCSPYTAMRGLLEHKPLLLSEELLAQAKAPPPTVTYPLDAPMLLVPSPLRTEGTLTAVTAGDAYMAALRDGLLLLGLRPGEVLLAPPTSQYLPATLLTTLLCGAAHVELSVPSAQGDAAALLREPAQAAVLLPAVRDILAAAGAGPARWKRWFRDPQEPQDHAGWESAEQRLRLSEIPHANLVWDAAAPGAVLVSPARRGTLHSFAAPAPGCSYMMAAPDADEPAAGALGRLVLSSEKGKPAGSPGEALLLHTSRGYVYSGSATPRRAGWSYPAAAVVAVLAASPAAIWLVGASIVAVPSGTELGQAVFVLVLFTGAASLCGIDSTDCVSRISHELGPAARPDRVEQFPLYPRRLGGKPDGPVDHDWVSAQYLRGELHRKSQAPVFQALTRTRAVLLGMGKDGRPHVCS